MGSVIRLFLLLGIVALAGCTSTSTTPDTRLQTAIVGGDQPGAFASIQAALDAAPADENLRYHIFISAGHYEEKLTIHRRNMEIRGAGAEATFIRFNSHAGNSKSYRADGWGTPGSAVVAIDAEAILLADLTIENTFDFLANDAKRLRKHPDAVAESQAVALLLDSRSDRISVQRVNLKGYQDTLFVHGNRAWFYQSNISGNVDFIFGQGNVLFEESTLISRPRNSHFTPGQIQGFITAPSTNIDREYGLTFIDCKLLREEGVPDHSVTLGRPWHPTTTFTDGRYADPDAIGKAVFIRTWMDRHISPQGWSSMTGTARDGSKTRVFTPEESRFFEYHSSGPGAAVNEHRRQLKESDLARYTRHFIFSGWNPEQ